MKSMMTKKAKKRIEFESVRDILYYFNDRYHDLSGLAQECGALYLDIQLNKGNKKAETYLQGLALGKPDESHPRQSWAIERLKVWARRSPASRLAYAASKTRTLRMRSESLGIEVE